MDAFVWDDRFTTGIDSVDQQHHRLVEVVNKLGDMMLAGDGGGDTPVEAIFKDLADYAHFHFADEERLMAEHRLDRRHVDIHRYHHKSFVEQVLLFWRSRGSMAHPAEVLHGFLSSWLSFHILGEDQAMARQVAAIRAGASPEAAFETDTKPVDNASSALLSALQKLYHVMAEQNRDLAEVNLNLEEKVAQRTRELADSNERLKAEHEEMRLLLEKVEQAQSQLLQSEKMASIGQLAAGVAHEINNPIGFVNSNLGTLKTYVDRLIVLIERCRNGECSEEAFREADFEYVRGDIADLVRESRDGLERVKKIVSDLKDFSHVDEAEWQEADLNAGLESTLNVVWNELKYKAQVVRDYGQLPLVRCIPAQLNQVFMNLLVNAAQAIAERGTITLRSGAGGDEVWLEVTDTGCGMTPEVQKRIFEPFYTTKPVGKGTGLGLSVSYDIVKKHGGRIEVESTVGRGTTFRVMLPVRGPSAE